MDDVVMLDSVEDVESRLETLGVTRMGLIQVIRKAIMARAESVPIDPVTSAGTLAYIYGTRALREMLLPQKWTVCRDHNIEATKHPLLNRRIIFQNTSSACDPHNHPQAISPKGNGTTKLLDALYQGEQLELFFPVIDNQINMDVTTADDELWYLCVAANDSGDICAELSRLQSVENSKFKKFSERIFILLPGEQPLDGINYDEISSTEFDNVEVIITRKQSIQSG